jgi:hypothetical protein
MPSLSSIPHETLIEIFLHLSKPDLAPMSRVNKIFQALLEPVLYKKIQWTWDHGAPTPPIHCLIESLLCRPLIV